MFPASRGFCGWKKDILNNEDYSLYYRTIKKSSTREESGHDGTASYLFRLADIDPASRFTVTDFLVLSGFRDD